MLMTLLTPDFEFEDNRGKLTQLVHEGFRQVNVITCLKDSFRGDHFHKSNNEAFYVVSGSFTLTLEKEGIKEEHLIKQGAFFLIPPFVNHSFFYHEDTLLVSMYSNGVELSDGTKDIFKPEL